MEVPVDGQKSAVELMMPFVLPPREAKEIARIKGKLTAVDPGPYRRVPLRRSVEGQKCGKTPSRRDCYARSGAAEQRSLGSIRPRPIRHAGRCPGLASRLDLPQRSLSRSGPTASRSPYDTMETTRQTKDEIGVAYIFVLEKPPADMKFIYKTPGAILGTTVEYEIRNLKLP